MIGFIACDGLLRIMKGHKFFRWYFCVDIPAVKAYIGMQLEKS